MFKRVLWLFFNNNTADQWHWWWSVTCHGPLLRCAVTLVCQQMAVRSKTTQAQSISTSRLHSSHLCLQSTPSTVPTCPPCPASTAAAPSTSAPWAGGSSSTSRTCSTRHWAASLGECGWVSDWLMECMTRQIFFEETKSVNKWFLRRRVRARKKRLVLVEILGIRSEFCLKKCDVTMTKLQSNQESVRNRSDPQDFQSFILNTFTIIAKFAILFFKFKLFF